jgi:predicted O-methyltransferase YrrM
LAGLADPHDPDDLPRLPRRDDRLAKPRPGSSIEPLLLWRFPTADPVLAQMERLASELDFLPVGPLVGRLLRQTAQAIFARDIFEMGSGVGYSTYFLAQAVGDGGRVVHTEFDAGRSHAARWLLQQAGLAERVTFEVGDAVDLIADYPGPFDLIFIDGDNARYPEALERARPRVRPGGYIITGNVLDLAGPDPATQGGTRYLKAALQATDLYTTVLPVGNGLALHLKLPEPGAEQRRKR